MIKELYFLCAAGVLLVFLSIGSGQGWAAEIICDKTIGFKNIEEFQKAGSLEKDVFVKYVFYLSFEEKIGVFNKGEVVKIISTKKGKKIVQVRAKGEWEDFWIPGTCLKE